MHNKTTDSKAPRKSKIVVVGCGVVGALVAYELNRQLEADITVLDRQQPAQGSTGAALGVLMGIISHKVKGRTWRLREASVRRYRSLIKELAQQGQSVPFNSQGIVSLCMDAAKLPRWQTLREKRLSQGWPLEIWSPEELRKKCPQVALKSETETGEPRTVKAAIYSSTDGQVHPAALTQALVNAAAAEGVTFHFGVDVIGLAMEGSHCRGVETGGNGQTGKKKIFEADQVVLCAGLGSMEITQAMDKPLALMPVLGQAMEIQLPDVLGDPAFQPVINADDIQCVPLGKGRYWLGATVEFPEDNVPLTAETEGLANLQRGAARFIPAMAALDSADTGATVLKTWSGLRPRPVGQPAPVIQPLANTDNVILATGHYRNGVLLAPATAQCLCDLIR
ncbi:MAG: FAD-dependent oxidoreductase [Cyanobacteria bacterium J06606_4]